MRNILEFYKSFSKKKKYWKPPVKYKQENGRTKSKNKTIADLAKLGIGHLNIALVCVADFKGKREIMPKEELRVLKPS